MQIKKRDLTFLGILRVIFKTAWIKFKWKVIVMFVCALFVAILETVAPKIVQLIIDNLEKLANPTNLEIRLYIILLTSLFGVGIAMTLFRFWVNRLSFFIATQVEDYWRYRVLNHFFNLPTIWHDKHDSGEFAGKIDRGASSIWTIIHELFGNNFLVYLITLIIVLIIAFISFPGAALILIIPIPIYVIVTFIVSQKIAKRQNFVNKIHHFASKLLYDAAGNVRSVKAFGTESRESKNYKKVWAKIHHLEYKEEELWLVQSLMQTGIETLMRIILLTFSIWKFYKNEYTIGLIVLLISYQQLTFAPLRELNSIFTRIRRVVGRSKHLFEILSEDDSLKDSRNAIDLKELRNKIVFDKVNFSYSKNYQALKDITVDFKKGEVVAIVGRSGAGKSTFSNLLLRFYDPDKGKVLWDGIDLRNARRASLRKRIAYIPQDINLFNRSIKDNITYGRLKFKEKEVIFAAKLAAAHEFISKMPKGYKSVIGERGIRLSGGQRQRIGIARAIFTGASVIIMDESTSHLDSESEQAIQEAIKSIHGDKTLVIIAHRLSTILNADKIIVMDQGKIIAEGRHKNLLKSCSIYKRLYDLQVRKEKNR